MSLSETSLTVIEGDARIADAHIQEVLGYGRVNDLHRIIRKHEAELEGYGALVCRSGKASSGQNTVAYYLTEEQATLVCMFARTPRAAEARRLIVEVFTRWRRGQVLPHRVETHVADDIALSKARYIELLEAENTLLRGPAKRPRKPAVPMTDMERQRVVGLIDKGLSLSEIARITGRSPSIISLTRTAMRTIRGGAA